jgi:SepF-like predicted cell division protein (DUF552 family)
MLLQVRIVENEDKVKRQYPDAYYAIWYKGYPIAFCDSNGNNATVSGGDNLQRGILENCLRKLSGLFSNWNESHRREVFVLGLESAPKDLRHKFLLMQEEKRRKGEKVTEVNFEEDHLLLIIQDKYGMAGMAVIQYKTSPSFVMDERHKSSNTDINDQKDALELILKEVAMVAPDFRFSNIAITLREETSREESKTDKGEESSEKDTPHEGDDSDREEGEIPSKNVPDSSFIHEEGEEAPPSKEASDLPIKKEATAVVQDKKEALVGETPIVKQHIIVTLIKRSEKYVRKLRNKTIYNNSKPPGVEVRSCKQDMINILYPNGGIVTKSEQSSYMKRWLLVFFDTEGGLKTEKNGYLRITEQTYEVLGCVDTKEQTFEWINRSIYQIDDKQEYDQYVDSGNMEHVTELTKISRNQLSKVLEQLKQWRNEFNAHAVCLLGWNALKHDLPKFQQIAGVHHGVNSRKSRKLYSGEKFQEWIDACNKWLYIGDAKNIMQRFVALPSDAGVNEYGVSDMLIFYTLALNTKYGTRHTSYYDTEATIRIFTLAMLEYYTQHLGIQEREDLIERVIYWYNNENSNLYREVEEVVFSKFASEREFFSVQAFGNNTTMELTGAGYMIYQSSVDKSIFNP